MFNQYATFGDYIIIKTLGSGTFAKVKLGYHQVSGTFRAIKIFKKDFVRHSEIENEITIQSQLNHPNIAQIIEYLEDVPYIRKNGQSKNVKVALVFELVAGGELFGYISYNGRFSEKVARAYFKILINAVQHIHDQGFAHRDLKLENILLDENFNLKLSDFGFSTLLCGPNEEGKLNTSLGTPGYAAPEILANKPYNGCAVDIFACGVILFVMIKGEYPFDVAKPGDIRYKFFYENKIELFWKAHDARNFLSKEFKNLISGMLAADPVTRLTIPEIIATDWYNGEVELLENIQAEFLKRQQRANHMIEKLKLKEKLAKEKNALAKEKARAEAENDKDSEHPNLYQGIQPKTRSNHLEDLTEMLRNKVDLDIKRDIKKYYPDAKLKQATQIFSGRRAEELLTFVCIACERSEVKYSLSDKQYKVNVEVLNDNGRSSFKILISQVDDITNCIEFYRTHGDFIIYHQSVGKIAEELNKLLQENSEDDDDGFDERKLENENNKDFKKGVDKEETKTDAPDTIK